MASDRVDEFRSDISDEQRDDLRRRLAATRWPETEPVDDWSQGIPLAYLKEVCAYWAEKYDWRAREAHLNSFPQYKTELDGNGTHFIHAPSPNENALPIVITHGWPGSIVEFHKVIEPLRDPASHGGDPADAFHVVCPSLPGYAFSDRPSKTGWAVPRIADAWGTLMARLGYGRYVAQGGDWGAMVTTSIGARAPEHCAAVHLNMPSAPPDPETMAILSDLTSGEARHLSELEALLITFPGDEERREPVSTRLDDAWDEWHPLLLALALLGCEWVLRKRVELV